VSGIGAPDYGHLLFMGVDGMTAAKTTEKGYRQKYTHGDETFRVGHYAVNLATGLRAEATATLSAGLLRFTFPADAEPVILLDLGHGSAGSDDGAAVIITDAEVTLDPDGRRLSGFATLHGSLSGRIGGLQTFFAAEVDAPVAAVGIWEQGELHEGETHRRATVTEPRVRLGAWLRVTAPASGVVHVKAAISFVDEASARANLAAEIAGFDFDAVAADAAAAWNDVLGRVEIEGGTPDERVIYYTALYHSFLMPNLFTDADGRYRGFDREVHDASGFRFFSNFSMWDTYRTTHSLITLLLPDLSRELMQSLTIMKAQGGFFPKWPIGLGEGGSMVGESAFIVLADAWVKGVTGFDTATAWQGVVDQLLLKPGDNPTAGLRECYPAYSQLGWCPADQQDGSASKTLEYAYDDFAGAALARGLGHAAEADLLDARARAAYASIWRADVAFFDGRNADGTFVEPFAEFGWGDQWTEGDAWQYRFFVPWDAAGLAALFGGLQPFVNELTRFFEGSVPEVGMLVPGKYYWHGNEPDIHAAWMFADVGRPELSQEWVRWVLEAKYKATPDGIDGNDDCGTLSAWYAFSALGLYPVPARDDYLIGSPVFERSVVHLAGGDLVIEAPGAGPANRYVQSATWNGEPLHAPRLHHADLPGGTLVLTLGPEPSGWGQDPDAGR
jgi:predicted alpha-1,2-mannosidase